MKTRTKKRAAQERKYRIERDRFIEDHPHICFFCDEPIFGEPDLHHLRGRDGDRLLDKENWVLVHLKCHTAYHSQSWEKLPWWDDYLYRLKIKNPQIYYNEILKMSKK